MTAAGTRSRFIADALTHAPRCDRETTVVCSHIHLAPVARLLAWRGARLTYVLCGIEAWVPLRAQEQWALSSDLKTVTIRSDVDFPNAGLGGFRVVEPWSEIYTRNRQ